MDQTKMLKSCVQFGFWLILLSLFTHNAIGQSWMITERTAMPEAVANNAVASGIKNGTPQVYSFGGIDTSKSPSGIHLRSFAYNSLSDSWYAIPDLPDTLGKVAAGASTIGDTIYIVGGYHVFSDFSEVSSNRLHRFHIPGDTFLADGPPIPVPIDDQVQMVYKNRYIYVVTGWHDNTNVPDVQIYDSKTNQWLVGTPVPDNNNFKFFGSSGSILNDTIYYWSGASLGFNFSASLQFIKGGIDPNDPTSITWTNHLPTTLSRGYRMASVAFPILNEVWWIGGSETTYNFDGIAYNGSGGVEPANRFLRYHNGSWEEEANTSSIALPMDLRGFAQTATDAGYLLGGMESGQQVTDRVLLLQNPQVSGVSSPSSPEVDFSIHPNPAEACITIQFGHNQANRTADIYSLLGTRVQTIAVPNRTNTICLDELPAGTYLLHSPAHPFPQKLILR